MFPLTGKGLFDLMSHNPFYNFKINKKILNQKYKHI